MSDPKKVKALRQKIDVVDDQLVMLISERANLAIAMKNAKGDTVIYRPARETEILRRVSGQNKGSLANPAIVSIFREIIGACRNLEKALRVAYLGPEGTYSHEAAIKLLGSTSQLIPASSLREVIRMVEADAADIACVPIENSTEGSVIETHRLLLNTPLKITGEFNLAVQHCLLSKTPKLEDLVAVYAHPQALGQCREWLRTHVPHAQLLSEASSAQAAKVALEEPRSAAIASEQIALITGMPILKKAINDSPNNQTRFIALGSSEPPATGQDKTSIVCSVKEKPGALYELLAPLAKRNITMTRLVSQPHKESQYVFYIDLLGHQEDQLVSEALAEIHDKSRTCIVLGSYPEATK